MDRDPPTQYDNHLTRVGTTAGMVSPLTADLLPHPPTFKTLDVRREMEKVRDARKRIRLDPSVFSSTDGNTPQGAATRQRSLPSICAYTLHDVHEGFALVNSLRLVTYSVISSSPCCTFSQDTSLMAAGFEESYIRLWNLKGEPLNGLQSEFQLNNIRDCAVAIRFLQVAL